MADFAALTADANYIGELLPTAATYYSMTNYVQRVYSSGLSAWCYYTKTSIDPTPLSTDTTPNWTGSITAFQVLAVI